jgi:hypothetical protein
MSLVLNNATKNFTIVEDYTPYIKTTNIFDKIASESKSIAKGIASTIEEIKNPTIDTILLGAMFGITGIGALSAYIATRTYPNDNNNNNVIDASEIYLS